MSRPPCSRRGRHDVEYVAREESRVDDAVACASAVDWTSASSCPGKKWTRSRGRCAPAGPSAVLPGITGRPSAGEIVARDETVSAIILARRKRSGGVSVVARRPAVPFRPDLWRGDCRARPTGARRLLTSVAPDTGTADSVRTAAAGPYHRLRRSPSRLCGAAIAGLPVSVTPVLGRLWSSARRVPIWCTR